MQKRLLLVVVLMSGIAAHCSSDSKSRGRNRATGGTQGGEDTGAGAPAGGASGSDSGASGSDSGASGSDSGGSSGRGGESGGGGQSAEGGEGGDNGSGRGGEGGLGGEGGSAGIGIPGCPVMASAGSSGLGGSGGSAGAAGAGGASSGMGGMAAMGGAAPTCTGAGICGRAADGIYCARSNGACGFGAFSRWSDAYSDDDGWNDGLHFWTTIAFPDLNADGRADICGRASEGISCGLSSGAAGFTTPSVWLAQFTDIQGWNELPAYWATLRFPDLDADGRADVCGRSTTGITCARSNGASAFVDFSLWSDNFLDADGWHDGQGYWGTIQFPDVNGDGRADVCGRSSFGTICELSNGSTFGPGMIWESSFSDDNGWNGPSRWGTIQYPDVNGDGRADICGRHEDGVYCARSNGTNAFEEPSLWADAFSDANGWGQSQALWGTIQFPDVNGDGRADICARGSNGLSCALSSGAAFGSVTTWAAVFGDANGFHTDATRWATLQYADLNRDGRADVCGRSPSGMICGVSTGSAFTVALWTDRFGDADAWDETSHALTLQMPNLNVPDCLTVTKASVYQPPVRRLAPF